jgi:hypothetical protein
LNNSRNDCLTSIIMGLSILMELILPIPFISLFVDGFFMKILGFKRMYLILLLTTIFVYVSKINVFFMAQNLSGNAFIGNSFLTISLITLPLDPIGEMAVILLFNLIFGNLVKKVTRRLRDI